MKTIAELRNEYGWSQAELARRLKVRRQSVHYWEYGHRTPSVRRLRDLARLFGVPMENIRLPKLNGKDDHADD